jgi:putative transposase
MRHGRFSSLCCPPPSGVLGDQGGQPIDLRRGIHGIVSVNKTGCPWRMLPTDIGNGQTISGYFRRWRRDGVWARVMETLHQWERQSQGRLPAPSACCAASQSIKTATQGADVGFDGHKQIKGRTRHIWVDTLGLMVAVVVTAAQRDARLGLVTLWQRYLASGVTRLRQIGGDGG